VNRRLGRFELAHGGTVFLDEIANISPTIQAKLLRILQDRSFERLGGTQTIKSDFRLICATNEDLDKLVVQERFRNDLFYRINVVTLTIPPLRQRREDIRIFIYRFMEEFASKHKSRVSTITDGAMGLLLNHDWPGNIRELRNVVENAVLLCAGDRIDVDDLKQMRESSVRKEIPAAMEGEPSAHGQPLHIEHAVIVNARGGLDVMNLKSLFSQEKEVSGTMLTKREISRGLKKHRGSVSKTAEHFGIKTPRLYYLMKLFNIKARDFRTRRIQ
jgi:two-component system response regulator AtoC